MDASENIERQINELRVMFDSKRIIDETSRGVLTKPEIESIRRIIKNKDKDGCYEVFDTLIVQLKDGYCYIKDNNDV